MRIGMNAALGLGGPQTITEVVEEIAEASRAGYRAAWMPHMPPWAGIASWDPLTIAAAAGVSVPDIRLGTSVVIAQSRHPLTLAGQALTIQSAIGDRFTLGIGMSGAMVVEPTFGFPFERPARYMREYLEVLMPALAGEPVAHQGEALTANGHLTLPGVVAPQVVLAALGPRMLRLAGELTDGTVTMWTGVRTVAEHITPRISAAAEAAGRPRPRVVVAVPICVTDDVEAARAVASDRFGTAGSVPSYGAMLEIEGVESAVDLVLVGSEEVIAAALRRYKDAGATEIIAILIGSAEDKARSTALLSSLTD